MSQKLTEGRWFNVQSIEQFYKLIGAGQVRVQRGTYAGPGKYLLLEYKQRCLRNCCDDDVNQMLSACEVEILAKEEMRELAKLLKVAKGVHNNDS